MRKAILGLAVATMTLPALPAPALAYQSGYYDRNGNYVGPVWQGQDGTRYCRRSNGTTGLIVGYSPAARWSDARSIRAAAGAPAPSSAQPWARSSDARSSAAAPAADRRDFSGLGVM